MHNAHKNGGLQAAIFVVDALICKTSNARLFECSNARMLVSPINSPSVMHYCNAFAMACWASGAITS